MIIRKIKVHKNYQFYCTGCESLLEAEYADVETRFIEPERYYTHFITCPVCGKETHFTKDEITQNFAMITKDVNYVYSKGDGICYETKT